MKKTGLLVLLGTLSVVATGCMRGDVSKASIAETYIHKYGLAIEEQEWNERGQNGRIVSNRKDGVRVTRNYVDGELDGDTQYTFPNSDVIAKIETYDAGALIAEQENYPTGNPLLERQQLEGGQVLEAQWYACGTPRLRETLHGNLLIAGEYFTLGNTLEGRIEDGAGTRIIRDAEGNLLSEDLIVEGRLTERTTFYPNGDPESATPFLNDQEHGKRLTFLPGGVPNTIEQWSHGERHGITTVFVNGERKCDIPYEHGRKHGNERRYGPEGQLVEEITWLRDVKHGADQFYVGNERKIDWYHHGQLVSKAIFDRLNPQAR